MTFEARGTVLRRRLWLLSGAAALFGVHIAAVGIGAPSWARVVYVGLASTLLLAFASDSYRAKRTGMLRADADGLRLDGAMVVPRPRIASAFVLQAGDPVVRVVRRRGLTFDVVLEDEERARPLVEALGFGIGQSIVTFRARYGGRLRALFVGLAAAVSGSAASIAIQYWGAVAGLVAMVAAALGVFLPLYLRLVANVDVGSDGVLLRRLGEQRFLPYSALVSVTAVDNAGIFLAIREGKSVRLSMGASTSVRDALVQRIEEAREAFAAGDDGGRAEALVAPGGRLVARWIADLRALMSLRGYREMQLEAHLLWQVVDDPRASPVTRAGAAVALTGELDVDARARLRVAAEACAEPKLRVALARVADGATDAELEEALMPLLESKS